MNSFGHMQQSQGQYNVPLEFQPTIYGNPYTSAQTYNQYSAGLNKNPAAIDQSQTK
jgi:hypothetical protein